MSQMPSVRSLPLRRPSRADALFEAAAVGGTLAVSAAAAAASFHGLRHVGAMAGLPHNLTWTVPVALDGLSIVASAAILVAHRLGGRTFYPWGVVVGSATASAAANAATAPAGDLLSMATLGGLPLALALAFHLLVLLVSARLRRADLVAGSPVHPVNLIAEQVESAQPVIASEPAPAAASHPMAVATPTGLLPTQRPVIPALTPVPVDEPAEPVEVPSAAEEPKAKRKRRRESKVKAAIEAGHVLKPEPVVENPEPAAPVHDLAALAHQAIQDLADQGRLTGSDDDWKLVLAHQPLLAQYVRPRRQISGRIATWRKALDLAA